MRSAKDRNNLVMPRSGSWRVFFSKIPFSKVSLKEEVRTVTPTLMPVPGSKLTTTQELKSKACSWAHLEVMIRHSTWSSWRTSASAYQPLPLSRSPPATGMTTSRWCLIRLVKLRTSYFKWQVSLILATFRMVLDPKIFQTKMFKLCGVPCCKI